MHFDITSYARAMAAFSTIHDGIFRETLLTGCASRRAAALKTAVSLRRLEGELEISANCVISRYVLHSIKYSRSPRKDLGFCKCLNIAILKKLFAVRSRAANASPDFGAKLCRD